MLAYLFADLHADRQEEVRFAAACFLDAAQDRLLCLRTEAFQRGEAACTRGLLELAETADAERLVKHADLFQSELRHAHQLEDSGRVLAAKLFGVLRRACSYEL